MLFINLDPGTRLSPTQTLTLLQNSFNVVHPSLNKYNGIHLVFRLVFFTTAIIHILFAATLNKVFMFDKVRLIIASGTRTHI